MKAAPVIAIVGAVALGLVGYALTGNPGLPASPGATPPLDARFTPEAEKASSALLENYGDVRAWLTLSDALIRAGRTETAVVALTHATEAIPGDVNLWVQMGVALVAHAGGQVVPAARLAFDRASRLAPDHPAPAYYLGLTWFQSGQPEQALAVWQALDARTTDDAPFKAMLGQQIRVASMMLAMQSGALPETKPPNMPQEIWDQIQAGTIVAPPAPTGAQ